MTPFQLYYRYKNLNVPLDESRSLTVGLHLYRNPRITAGSHAMPEDSRTLVQGVNQQLRRRYREATGRPAPSNFEPMEVPADQQADWYPALRNRPIRIAGNNWSFSGRGSPEEIELALAAVASVERVDQLRGMTAEQKIQHLIDTYIGLDCVGFAGNFFISSGYSWGEGPANTTPPNVYASHGREIGLEDPVPVGAVLLFPLSADPFRNAEDALDFEHIVLVESYAPPRCALLTAESCGSRGLATGVYRRTGNGGPAATTWSNGKTIEHVVHELINPDGRKVYVVIRALMG